MGWQESAAGTGITAAAIAAIYAAIKMFRRSRCQSHTGCCDLDIARAKTQRTERSDPDIDEIVLRVMQSLPAGKGKSPEKKKPTVENTESLAVGKGETNL